jgi:hypothetical protein
MSTVPAVDVEGTYTDRDESEVTVYIVVTDPNITYDVFVNPLPEIVTVFPPVIEPELGETPMIIGTLPVA